MSAKKRFTIAHPPVIFWLCIILIGFFVVLAIAYTLFSPPPHTAMYVCFTLFIWIPGCIVTIWTRTFLVTVNGTSISVRKGLGLSRFQCDVSDITRVKWKTVDTNFGRNMKITLFTAQGKRIPVETLMVNSDHMIRLIETHIAASKIERSYKSFVKQ